MKQAVSVVLARRVRASRHEATSGRMSGVTSAKFRLHPRCAQVYTDKHRRLLHQQQLVIDQLRDSVAELQAQHTALEQVKSVAPSLRTEGSSALRKLQGARTCATGDALRQSSSSYLFLRSDAQMYGRRRRRRSQSCEQTCARLRPCYTSRCGRHRDA